MNPNLDRFRSSAPLSDLFHFRNKGRRGRCRKRTNPCSYKHEIPVPHLRLQLLTRRRYLNSNITGVATKINLLMYVEHEQPSYAAVLHVITHAIFSVKLLHPRYLQTLWHQWRSLHPPSPSEQNGHSSQQYEFLSADDTDRYPAYSQLPHEILLI